MAKKITRDTHIGDIQFDTRNANKGTERGGAMLKDSLERYGAGRSILLDRNGRVIAGNKTLENAKALGFENVVIVPSDGTKIIAVQRTDVDLDSKEGRELAIADNRVAEANLEWDAEQIKALMPEIDVTQFWTDEELAEVLGEAQRAIEDAPAARTLAERFGVPPFSVLDARQGYWQDRKRAWLSLGIQSELGRGGGQGMNTHSATITQNPDGTLNYGEPLTSRSGA